MVRQGTNIYQKDEIIEEPIPKPNAKLIREVSYEESPYYESSYIKPYNPDDLYQKKGNYEIYDDMRDDDQVKAVLAFKKYLALSSGYDFVIDGDPEDKQLQEIKEFLWKAFNNMLL